jgi:dTDP-4-dehydrorhamnose reductase
MQNKQRLQKLQEQLQSWRLSVYQLISVQQVAWLVPPHPVEQPLEADVRGIVHLAGPEATTWHDVLVRAKRAGGLAGAVVALKADEAGRPAPRPANSSLTSAVLDGTPVPPMPPLDDAIGRVLADV